MKKSRKWETFIGNVRKEEIRTERQTYAKIVLDIVVALKQIKFYCNWKILFDTS